MGLRSWLSPMTDKSQWQDILTSINENSYANGIHYVIKIEKEGSPFPIGSVVVAWSAAGTSSINELKPQEVQDNSWLLDNLLDSYPEWHTEPGGPAKYGRIFKDENEIEESFQELNG